MRSALCLSVFLLLAACAPVNTIAPVAALNERNAAALKKNTEELLAVAEMALRVRVEIELIAHYQRVSVRAVGNFPPPPPTLAAAQGHYDTKAAALRTSVANISGEPKNAQIGRLHDTHPIAASVAFGNMTSADAAALAMSFAAIRRDTSLSAAEKNTYYRTYLEELPSSQAIEQAAADVLAAFEKMKLVITQQLANSSNMAHAFSSAASANASPSQFIAGITGDDEVLGALATIVKSRTKDPDRLKAADELLASLKKTKKD
ncbi:MAG: hypothetical protein GY716_13625 [bacterium]|nr:hypothetical protein [bacterium]